jgi:hypothetical protein
MTNSKELSDLSMSRAECPKCGAVWMNGQHTWATGAKGNELDLAGLVCNSLGSHQCINPKRGMDGGDTWEKRLDKMNEDFNT